eukprot:CAMPEP_0116144912 /NCGR_PEP_ID=MMETSP0329-20121206/16284_1 /TAXON_ID=697910 /ORGANISM="Pseudo-nitzschia arenysensis, Strain B593" /LENGTH=651 /DNA_ID=CAMNT_0003640425 /DNA_START=184 /DNA_END=2139 /DNA_ORIENTATION=-
MTIYTTTTMARSTLISIAAMLILGLGSNILVSCDRHVVIAPRHCHGSVRHLHLAVGNAPSASRSMTISFASTWAFPDRVAPVAGVFVGTIPPPNYHSQDAQVAEDASHDYTDFLAESIFYPEQEDPLTYTILMEHRNPDAEKYHAPFQHHITVGGLEPGTTYYYLPVLGDRETGIESLEEDARVHFDLLSAKEQLKDQEGQHAHAVDISSGTQLNKEQQKLIEEAVDGGHRKLQISARKQHFEYDESYLARDYDANMEIVEVSPNAPVWDQNGRRLSPDPYDPTGIACIDAGKVRSFETAPDEESALHEHLYPMHFGVIGDIGQFSHSQQVLNHLRDHRKGIKAVVLVGDIAYPEYDGRRWDTFFDFLDDQGNFDEIPLMVAAGNHDIDKQYAGNEIFLAYEKRFRMPRLKPPELGVYDGDCEDGKMNMDAPPYPLPYEWGNSYYSFTYGPTRHIIVNAYADMSPESPQYEWLKAELASIDRTKTPWVLLTMHPPIYNTFALHHHDPQIFAAKEHLEPLFVEHHVNLVLTGHIHAYQRTDYVAFGNLTDTGPVHITIGAGGRKCDAPFSNKEPEEWIQSRDASMYGYGRLSIHNETHAEWRWIPIAPSELHDYNQVKNEDELHLPSLDHDKVVIENQHFRRLRKLEREEQQ